MNYIQNDLMEFVPAEKVGEVAGLGPDDQNVQTVWSNDLTAVEAANLALALADLIGVTVSREPMGKTLVLTKKGGFRLPSGAPRYPQFQN
ncbi:hypothetical protein [Delftia phage PhiW-14]|uniref:Uncharacterized protein n=1 Tax=Delftia phage PhiW-14 TaxID=665032 RepID=C9DG89_BPW14|nr:hypothetical protein DP-phiW-14_gp119 [Delftia phage PhiW-14]ACV50140.1 hypothetical protein [Delftia phage PhiW-14]